MEWRDVIGYEDLYKISEYGVVKSLTRVVNGPFGSKKIIKEYIRKKVVKADGYVVVRLSKESKAKTYGIHVLVAKAWYLNNSIKNNVVKHLDNNPSNNHYSNLMFDTQSQNTIDAINDGLCKSKKGENHHGSKLTSEDVLFIRSSNLKGVELARLYNITTNQISCIKLRKSWAHI